MANSVGCFRTFMKAAQRIPQGCGPETSFSRLEIESCGRPIRQFSRGRDSQYVVQKPDGKSVMGNLQVPSPRSKNHPVIVPKSVICSQLPEGIGWLKVTMFPGAVGIDLAHALDTAFAHLRESTRLIVDLRGNTGGGIGGLRLMSYLTPGKTEVGYSLRVRAKRKGTSGRSCQGLAAYHHTNPHCYGWRYATASSTSPFSS